MAYMRRVRWEARVHAVEMGKVLAELLGRRRMRRPGDGERRRPEVARPDRAEADGLLAKMGVKVGRLKRNPGLKPRANDAKAPMGPGEKAE